MNVEVVTFRYYWEENGYTNSTSGLFPLILFPAKHPEVKSLFGYDARTKWILLAVWTIQVASLWIVKDLSFFNMFLMAYFFTGVINHSFTLGKVIWALIANHFNI